MALQFGDRTVSGPLVTIYHRAAPAAFALLLASTALASPARAQDAVPVVGDPAPGAADNQDGDHHAETSNEIVVTGVMQTNRQDMLSAVGVLSGAALDSQVRPSIGETLAHLPGVTSSAFGPTASRPILRGLQGERVSVLTNGIGSIDVSNTSADHAVAVDPLLADRIEVLRGPQALLYGTAAVGGVVNVTDKRIPNAIPESPAHVEAKLDYGSAANQRAGAATVDVPLGGGFVFHADGSYARTDDLKIGGYALTPALRDEALASYAATGDETFAENAAIRGTLPNTASETWGAAAGLAYVGEGGSLGVAYSHHDTLYGIPVRFATRPGQEQEAPRLSLAQDRIDARAEIDPDSGFVDKIRLRWGYADYSHFELEEDGAVGTAFYNKGQEGRLEVAQARIGGWSGASGVQWMTRDFNVVGEEAFLPKNATVKLGLFTVQQYEMGPVKVEGGARFEHSTVTALPDGDQDQFFAGSRRFDTVSGSLGASYAVSDTWKLAFNASHTERAPSAEELYANGPHAGTEAFEIGNPDFGVEKANSVEAILRGKGDGWSLEASGYHSWFSGYIYDAQTGAMEDGLPVYQGRQGDARYYGFEVQGDAVLADFGDSELSADLLADYTHATIEAFGPAPRIPPLRILGGLGLKGTSLDARAEVEWTARQSRVAPLETETPGYTMVNASVTWRPWGEQRPLELTLTANNIFDVDARRASSYLKDYAPLAGRDIRVGARITF